MNATLKLTLSVNEAMPNGEVLFIIRQKLMKRMATFKKNTNDFIPKSCTVRFELAGRNQFFEKSDYILFAHDIAKMFGTECRWHTEALIPVIGAKHNLIIYITLTDEG